MTFVAEVGRVEGTPTDGTRAATLARDTDPPQIVAEPGLHRRARLAGSHPACRSESREKRE